MPKVSIITCTYNRAHLIGDTILSILGQTFRDFEYIIIDDGSEDNTEEKINSFCDDRIRFFRHSRTGGHLSLLRNFGHEKSTGEYIAYVDSDDIWEPEKLEIQIMAMEEDTSIGFSFTDVDTFNQMGVLQGSLYKKSGEFTGSVFSQMLSNSLIICHTTLVIRATCLKMIGHMDETLHSGDHDMVFFLSRHFPAYTVFKPLVHVRKHAQNSTGSPALSIGLLEEHHKSLEKLRHQNLITSNEFRRAYARTSYSFGIQALQISNFVAARRFMIKCLVYRPFHWKAWVRLMLMLPK